MSKPREFWIERKSFSSSIICAYEEKPDEITYRIAKDIIHVIEHSAYADLLAENAELRGLLGAAALCVGGLTFGVQTLPVEKLLVNIKRVLESEQTLSKGETE